MIGQRGLPASYGGVERHVEELGVRLAERGHEVVVFCRRNYTDDQRPSHRGVKLVYAPTVESKHLEAALHSGAASMLTLGRGFDIVHYHAVGPGLWSPIPRWFTGAKIVQTIHGLAIQENDPDRGKWGRLARTVLQGGDWLSQRVPDAVIVVGEYLLDHYRHRRGLTVHIPNGVTSSTATDSSVLARLGLHPRRYALFVGRLIPEKGVDQMIRAFSQVDTSHRLAVVGGSSFTDDYELIIKRLAAADPRVALPGYVYGAELAALFANASVYVQPSLLEGLPLTVLEAASHGLPLVLSDIPAHREILPETRVGGRLYPAGDVGALSAALDQALAGADRERDAASAAGRQTIRRYRWEAVTDETEALYHRIAA